MGSMRSMVHACGSGWPFCHTLPRARTLPPSSDCTSSFIVYQTSLSNLNGVLTVRLVSGCQGWRSSRLVVAEDDELVTLRDDADVAHQAAALHPANVGLDRVVAHLRRAEERPAPLGEREVVFRQLDQHLAAVEIAHRELVRGVRPLWRRHRAAVLEVEAPRQIGDDADAGRPDDGTDRGLTSPACAPAAGSAVNLPSVTVPFRFSTAHVAGPGMRDRRAARIERPRGQRNGFTRFQDELGGRHEQRRRHSGR